MKASLDVFMDGLASSFADIGMPIHITVVPRFVSPILRCLLLTLRVHCIAGEGHPRDHHRHKFWNVQPLHLNIALLLLIKVDLHLLSTRHCRTRFAIEVSYVLVGGMRLQAKTSSFSLQRCTFCLHSFTGSRYPSTTSRNLSFQPNPHHPNLHHLLPLCVTLNDGLNDSQAAHPEVSHNQTHFRRCADVTMLGYGPEPCTTHGP